MITALIIMFYVCLFLFGVGTVLAFFSSWRDGCLGRDMREIKSGLAWVFLRIKIFAQLFFNRTAYRHLINYWMFYALGMGLLVVAFSG